MEDGAFWYSFDLACACAFWEDELFQLKESKETAGQEAGEIGQVLETYRKQLNERG
jgi:hypothetical protein